MKKLFVLLVLVIPMIGCQGAKNPEKAALRETLYQGIDPILEDHQAWADKLVAYPAGTVDPRTGKVSDGKNRASEIPALTPAQYNQASKLREELKAAVEEDRARDNQPLVK